MMFSNNYGYLFNIGKEMHYVHLMIERKLLICGGIDKVNLKPI